MKKLFIALLLMMALISSITPNAKAIGITIKVGKGIAMGGNCQPGDGICFIVILTRTLGSAGLARSEAGTDIELIDGTGV